MINMNFLEYGVIMIGYIFAFGFGYSSGVIHTLYHVGILKKKK